MKQRFIILPTSITDHQRAMAQTHTLSCSALFSCGSVEEKQSPDESAIADQLWSILVDWDRWKNWWPGVVQLSRLDEGIVGRGSRFRVYKGRSAQMWVINYWKPGHALELIVDSRKKPHAIRICLSKDPLAKTVNVEVNGEYELSAFQQLIAPFLLWRLARQQRTILETIRQQLNNRNAG
jgi:hypothetical protein